jgi:hypothetical protein
MLVVQNNCQYRIGTRSLGSELRNSVAPALPSQLYTFKLVGVNDYQRVAHQGRGTSRSSSENFGEHIHCERDPNLDC